MSALFDWTLVVHKRGSTLKLRYLVPNRHKSGLMFRLVVPVALRSLLGRREIRRSLSHLSIKEATQLAVELHDALTAQFDILMKKPKKALVGEISNLFIAKLESDESGVRMSDVTVENDADLERLAKLTQLLSIKGASGETLGKPAASGNGASSAPAPTSKHSYDQIVKDPFAK